MNLNDVRIDDFGCFRNARIEDLDDSLVVIGGPQRAGKTTFMQALRQFPEGVSRGSDLPPATDEYRIDAEVTHDGHRYRYVLNGYASPSVSPVDGGPEIDAGDIFGPVSERQYRNLYTISLDELRRLPPGIDDAEDIARVLLGGAYGDIAEIPAIEETFSDRAYDIGLSRGDPSTKSSDLNDPYKKIQEGMEARKEASDQVDEYKQVTEELDEKRSEEADIEEEIDNQQRVRDRLNVLKELFGPLRELERLNAQLDDVDEDELDDFPLHLTDKLKHFQDKFETATEQLTEARQEFQQDATIDTTEEYYEWLLDHEAEIDGIAEDRKVLAKTAEDLIERQKNLEQTKQELESEIAILHSEWDGSFDHIDEIETSAVETAQLHKLTSTLDDLTDERDGVETDLKSAKRQKKELETDLAEMEEEHEETREISVSKRDPAIVAALALLVGTGVGFGVTPIAGGLAGFIVLAVGLYVIDLTETIESTIDADPYREVKGQVANLESEIEAKSERLDTVNEDIEDAKVELTEYITEIGIPPELPTSDVASFYDDVVKLDEEIGSYRADRRAWDEEKEEFADDFQDVSSLVAEVTTVPWTAEQPLEDVDEVVNVLESITADLDLARERHRAEEERANWIEEIDTVLTEWDEDRSIDPTTQDEEILHYIQAFNDEAERTSELQDEVEERDQFETQVTNRLDNESAREAFEPLRTDGVPWVDVVRSVAAEYTDTDAIADDINEKNREIEELTDERDELRDDCIELGKDQDELASEADLRDARAKIEEGRVEFERLGEAYAVNRVAESMVTQLHERLMEDIVHSLVDDASEIFSEITQEYDGIELEGDVQNLAFHALRSDTSDHGVGELSRATAEQLFLAVRLARIKQTEVSLPVVLDDAATNFDPNHMTRVFEVIDQLTGSNQVFFLTCHPQCVRITASNDLSAQYWSLDGGQFSRQDTADTLQQQLSAD